MRKLENIIALLQKQKDELLDSKTTRRNSPKQTFPCFGDRGYQTDTVAITIGSKNYHLERRMQLGQEPHTEFHCGYGFETEYVSIPQPETATYTLTVETVSRDSTTRTQYFPRRREEKDLLRQLFD